MFTICPRPPVCAPPLSGARKAVTTSDTSMSVCTQTNNRDMGGRGYFPPGLHVGRRTCLSPRGGPARRHLSTLSAWGGVRCSPVRREREAGRERQPTCHSSLSLPPPHPACALHPRPTPSPLPSSTSIERRLERHIRGREGHRRVSSQDARDIPHLNHNATHPRPSGPVQPYVLSDQKP